jgi:hypothetical protein
MTLIDQILNAAGLLLWLNWRSIRVISPTHTHPLSLLSALKRTEPHRVIRGLYLIGLILLLAVRSIFYWDVGSAVGWTPLIELGPVALPFRSDYLSRMGLFSVLSFGTWLGTFYSWLLIISVINRKLPDTDPMQKLVRIHLGLLEKLPALLKFFLPWIIVFLLWAGSYDSLTKMGLTPPISSAAHLLEEAVVLGLSGFLAWRFLILGLLLLHVVNSYVYLGDFPWLQFVSTTTKNLLHGLDWLPHRFGKVDVLPILAIAAVAGLDRLAAHGLPRLLERLPL